jgi:hypothetical protein
MTGSQSLSSTFSSGGGGGSEDEKNNDHDSISTHLSPSLKTTFSSSPSRRSSTTRMHRKPSVLDTISPNRIALQQIKSEGSFVHAYPNASADTKVMNAVCPYLFDPVSPVSAVSVFCNNL